MTTQLRKELNVLKENLVILSNDIENRIHDSIYSFIYQDKVVSSKIIISDESIYGKITQFEEECLKIIALYQPVASDLRMVIAYLKINNDLKKICSLTISIARKSIFLSKFQGIDFGLDYSDFVENTKTLFKDSVTALTELDEKLAKKVLKGDIKISKAKKIFKNAIITNIKMDPTNLDLLLRHHAFIRHIERIADMATNIAEDVLYIITGKVSSKRLEQDYIEDHS